VALRRFVDEQKAERDLIAVMTSAGKPGVTGEFTADESIVKAAMDKIRPGIHAIRIIPDPRALWQGRAKGPASCRPRKPDPRLGEPDFGKRADAPFRKRRGGCREQMQMQLPGDCIPPQILMNAIGAAVDKMSGLPGQHMIALFTEGFSMVATGGRSRFPRFARRSAVPFAPA